MQLIEKLPSGSTSNDGVWWTRHPTQGDIAEKVDEIIDVVNKLIKTKSLRPKGEWRYDEVEMEWSCSECLREAPIGTSAYLLTDFCPHCGADMRKDDNNE